MSAPCPSCLNMFLVSPEQRGFSFGSLLSCLFLFLLSVAAPSACGRMREPTLCPVELSGGLHHPTHVQSLAEDDSLLVSEQPGLILHLDQSSGSRSTVLDLRDRVLTSDSPREERGLLSFALDRRAQPHWLYVCYCAQAVPTFPAVDHLLVVARFNLSRDNRGRLQGNVTSESRLLSVGQPGPNRNGGYLFFGPPNGGLLYVTLGSGGGADDNTTRFDPTTLLGKVLRLNVSRPSENYTIPEDNPFSGASPVPPGSRPEIFALGLWNPWRCSVDHQHGERVLCGDVGSGPDNTDLVINLVSGGVYGCPPDCQPHPTGGVPERALYAHKHEQGQALIGGPFYRGTALPQLTGAYLFGDFVHGCLHALWEGKSPDDEWTKTDILLDKQHIPDDFFILSINTDHNGEPLLTVASDLRSSSATGSIYRLEAQCKGGTISRSLPEPGVLIAVLLFLEIGS